MLRQLRRRKPSSKASNNGKRLYANVIATAAVILTAMFYLHTCICSKFDAIEQRIHKLEMQNVAICNKFDIEIISNDVTLPFPPRADPIGNGPKSHIVKIDSKMQFQVEPGLRIGAVAAGSRRDHR